MLRSEVQCSHNVTFINMLGRLQIGKAHSDIDHTPINRRMRSSVLHIQSFSTISDHYLVVTKVKDSKVID
jgi:hypothetical protein